MYSSFSTHQVNEQSMVDITHEEAVSILKATHDSVVLQVEKNAIAHTGAPASPSEVGLCMRLQ